MPTKPLALLALIVASGPVFAQGIGVHLAPTLTLVREGGETTETVRAHGELTFEARVSSRFVAGFSAAFMPVAWADAETAQFPFNPGEVKAEYLVVAPLLAYQPSGPSLQPRLRLTPVLAYRIREQTTAPYEDGSGEVQRYKSSNTRGIAAGATAAAGVVVPLRAGPVRTVRAEATATYLAAGSDVAITGVGVRLGIGLHPPPSRRR